MEPRDSYNRKINLLPARQLGEYTAIILRAGEHLYITAVRRDRVERPTLVQNYRKMYLHTQRIEYPLQ